MGAADTLVQDHDVRGLAQQTFQDGKGHDNVFWGGPAFIDRQLANGQGGELIVIRGEKRPGKPLEQGHGAEFL